VSWLPPALTSFGRCTSGSFQYPGPRGARPIDLAATAGTTKQVMNHLLGQLDTLGFIERRERGSIWLTAKGERATAEIRRAVTRNRAAVGGEARKAALPAIE